MQCEFSHMNDSYAPNGVVMAMAETDRDNCLIYREGDSVKPRANDWGAVEGDLSTRCWRRGGAVTVEMQDKNQPC